MDAVYSTRTGGVTADAAARQAVRTVSGFGSIRFMVRRAYQTPDIARSLGDVMSITSSRKGHRAEPPGADLAADVGKHLLRNRRVDGERHQRVAAFCLAPHLHRGDVDPALAQDRPYLADDP